MRGNTLKKGDGIGYTQIANSVLNNKKLSLKAKGLYAFMYSKPDGWQFAGDRIAVQTKDGRKAVYNALNELLEQGYITRQKLQTGRVEYTIWVHPKFGLATPNALFGKVRKGQSAERGNCSISNKEEDSNKEEYRNTDKGDVDFLKPQEISADERQRRKRSNKTQRIGFGELAERFKKR